MNARVKKLSVALAVAASAVTLMGAATAKADDCGRGGYYYRSYSRCYDAPRVYYRSCDNYPSYYAAPVRDYGYYAAPSYPRYYSPGYSFSVSVDRGYRGGYSGGSGYSYGGGRSYGGGYSYRGGGHHRR